MYEIIKNNQNTNTRVIRMTDMKPGQIGRIVGESFSNGHIVMRTVSSCKLEIMDLTEFKVDNCWTTKGVTLLVELLPPEESVLLRVFNK